MVPLEEFAVARDDAGVSARAPARRRDVAWSGPWPWAVLAVILVVAGTLAAPQQGPVVDPWGYVPALHDEPCLAWEAPVSADAFWVFSGVVVTRAPDGVTGIDSASGDEIWRLDAEEPTCTSDGVDLTCTNGPDTVQIIDPQSGWARPYEIPGVAAAASVDDDIVAVTAQDVRRVTVSGELVWSRDVAFRLTLDAGPEVLDGMVLMTLIGQSAPGPVLDADTGRTLSVPDAGISPAQLRDGLWRSSDQDAIWLHRRDDPALTLDGWVSWSVTAQDPGLIRAIDEKELNRWRPVAFLPDATLGFLTQQEHGPSVLIAEDPATGDELWRTGPEILTFDPPLLGPETFLYSDSSELIALDIPTGGTRWTLTPGDVILDVTSDGERLYVLGETGVIGWDLS